MKEAIDRDQLLLDELLHFVEAEREAAEQHKFEIWRRPLADKLAYGWTQAFARLEPSDNPNALWATLAGSESRWREGDLLALYTGSPFDTPLGHGYALEAEDDGRWLLRGDRVGELLAECAGRRCYADPDTLDLAPYYRRALEEIRVSRIGREIILPLLADPARVEFDAAEVDRGVRVAREHGLNEVQAEAVGRACGAATLACIQGPPGTGKTRVLALAVRLMVERGDRVLLTSHSHMAINHALNQIQAHGVPTVKVGRLGQRKGLLDGIACRETLGEWDERPAGGYVVGATPFATGSRRLESFEFDTVVFDEASQVTVALALMAMRKGRRYVFVGDHRQLPPVMLSRSVLAGDAPSAFARLTEREADHGVMLTQTYRMNRWLTQWPSKQHYHGALQAAGPNRERRLVLQPAPAHYAAIFDPDACGVFVPTRDPAARSRNESDAELVVELCGAAVQGGLGLERIGIVAPYREQGAAIRRRLAERYGADEARRVIADTVERMQGQERELVILSLASGDTAYLAAVATFFFQPERLNVSITRAISKLIVIGPPPEALPRADDRITANWIDQYRDLVQHLHRVPP